MRSRRRFLPDIDRERAKIDPHLRQRLREVCEGIKPWPIFISGPPGCGKTCAALCLADAARGDGRFYNLADLCEEANRLRNDVVWYPGPRGGRRTEDDLWREIRSAALVVVDEVGTRANVSDSHYEVLKKVLDRREGLPLVVLSNLLLRDLGQVYDGRIVSRLGAGTAVALGGPDRRLHRQGEARGQA